MALVINTNLSSILVQKHLESNTLQLNKSVERLSSGLRINSARDDAAGLSLSEKMRAHERSMQVAIRNAMDGISMLQIAEGGMKEVNNILVRMRELAQQAANGTLADGSAEILALDAEYQELVLEIARISGVTEFNGVSLLGAGGLSVNLQIGFRAGDTLAVAVPTTDLTTLAFVDLTTNANAAAELTTIDAAIESVSAGRGDLGANMSRLDSAVANLRNTAENYSAAISRIRDADFAYETAQFTKTQILVQSATSVLAQANVLPQTALQLLR